jgi:hypothetical protein
MKRSLLLYLLLPILATSAVRAEERTLTAEQMEALSHDGDLTEEQELERPKNLPDLTKGGLMPKGKGAPPVWIYGPTGIGGQVTGKQFQGDQILVSKIYKGSPAEGKFMPGDVIIGMNGKKFVAGSHLAMFIGKAILEAEKEENAGKISFLVWRDRNYKARSATTDVTSIDVDKLFSEVENDNSLYDWKPEAERTEEVKKVAFDKFPIDPVMLEIDLKIRTLPAYSDTAPYDCPKTMLILEEAWKVLEQKFIVDPKNPKNSGKGGMVEALALVASGKAEHRKLVHDWVRSSNSPWKPPTEPIGEMFKPDYKGYRGYQSWHKGFVGLDCALYYDATGDDYVLPALHKNAVEAAMGQSWLGSWGHTFAFPSFNGGKLHQMNPGYGALNAAGNRCFFLITLAQKLGIKDPEIDAAVERARGFFGSYTDQGCIPYGDHGAAGSDDSNGKNSGVAFAMKLLGDNYKAKYFAMMSSHCAFTRRGGHGHDYTGEWSSWAATLCGPKVRIANERNLRWYRTLCRMHDGSFVYNSPTGYGLLRDPTATEVLHQSVIFGQTLITGKDADKNLYPNEREMKQLMLSGRGQFNDPGSSKKSANPGTSGPRMRLSTCLISFIQRPVKTSPRKSASATQQVKRTSFQNSWTYSSAQSHASAKAPCGLCRPAGMKWFSARCPLLSSGLRIPRILCASWPSGWFRRPQPTRMPNWPCCEPRSRNPRQSLRTVSATSPRRRCSKEIILWPPRPLMLVSIQNSLSKPWRLSF